MVETIDVGSIPLEIEEAVIIEGARKYQSILPLLKSEGEKDLPKIFEETVVKTFIDKLMTGINVPNYPQLRDMNEMFFEIIRNIKKTKLGYISHRSLTAKPGVMIPEVEAIKKNASLIKDLTKKDIVRIKICITGPYTLATFFKNRDHQLIKELGLALAEIASESIFKTRYAKVLLLSIDEPVLGFLNDPMLDYGSEGREILCRAWEKICNSATEKSVDTSIHLHNTSDNIHWGVKNLGIVDSHVEDVLYSSEDTKTQLENTDKRLKASIAITNFDNLIINKLSEEKKATNLHQRLGEVWSDIRKGDTDPLSFLEERNLLLKRLKNIANRYGHERIAYAGPECGLKSFPDYESALECLRRVSKAVTEYNEHPFS